MGKICFSSFSQKCSRQNQISVFINCQYLTSGLTSDADFLHVDRHEWLQQSLVMGFLQKFSFRENGPSWAQKRSHNFLSAQRIFLKSCTMNGTKRYTQLILMVFMKKSSSRANGPFYRENGALHNSGSTLRILLKSCMMKWPKRYMKIVLMVFQKKVSFWTNGLFWARKWCDFTTLDPLSDFF